jgi:hypothetical protein
MSGYYTSLYRLLEDGGSRPYAVVEWLWPIHGKSIMIKTIYVSGGAVE